MRTKNRPPSLVRSLVVAPLGRLDQCWADVAGCAGGIIGYIAGAPLASIILFLFVAALWDHRLGRAVAKRGLGGKKFDPLISQTGFLSKMSGVGYVLLLRWLESILHAQGLWDRAGMLAFAFALVLALRELDSIDRNRELLSGRATPIVRPILKFLQSIADRLIPVPVEGSK